MLKRRNRFVPLKNALDYSAIVSCVCKKLLSFFRVPCSSGPSTKLKLGLLLTGNLNNGNQLKTICAALQTNVFDINCKFPRQYYPGRDVSNPRCQGQSCSPHSRTVNNFVACVRICVVCMSTEHGDWMIVSLFLVGKEVHEKSQTRLGISKLGFKLGTAEYTEGVQQGLRHCSVHLRTSV